MYPLSWFLFAVNLVNVVLGARILGVFPIPSFSHHKVFRVLVNELAQRGHELVILTTHPEHLTSTSPPVNITEINTYNPLNEIWLKAVDAIVDADKKGHRSMTIQYKVLMDIIFDLFDAQMHLPEVRRMVKDSNNKFDLIMCDGFVRPAHAFGHIFNAPVIMVSPMLNWINTFEEVGCPTHPILYADFMRRKIVNVNIFDKIEFVYHYLWQKIYDYRIHEKVNKMWKKHFGPSIPSLKELESQMDMMFLNVHPVWEGIRPVPPGVIFTGGMHLKPPKAIPDELNAFLDNSTRGVVYMSLGSNIKSVDLPKEKLKVFLEVFRNIPFDVLWKWEADELPEKPDNVRIAKWLPQANMLRHPSVKVFITQGGLQSTDEAILAGVPLIGIPFFADQDINVDRYIKHGVGQRLDILTLTVDQLDHALRTVIGDVSYRDNVRRMSRLMADQPMSGTERAVWWTEYVIRHRGAKHLRSPAAGVSVIEYFMLDVLSVMAVAVLAVSVFVMLLLRMVFYGLTKLSLNYKVKIN